jgi:nucleoid-associated protein YgaU
MTQVDNSGRENLKSALKNARRYSFELITGALLGITLLVVSLIFFRFQYYKNLGKQQLAHSTVTTASETLVTELPQATDPKINDKLPVRYELKQGDTLWKIAATVYGDGNKYLILEQANHLKPNAILVVGQVILIPKLEGEKLTYTPQVESKPTTAAPTQQAKNSTVKSNVKIVKNKRAVVTQKVAAKPKTTQTRVYIVKKGDSLWKISGQQYGKGKHWPTIYKANQAKIGKNPNLIYPKTKLSIPKLSTATAHNQVK